MVSVEVVEGSAPGPGDRRGAPRPAGAGDLLARLDPSQRDAVLEPGRPLAILAGAGSGKTRVLTRRIAWGAATGRVDLDRVLAVTFTRKAAGELVRRLETLTGAGRVTAGTFHALALAQLRRRWHERGRGAPVLLERKARLLVPLLGGGPQAIARAADVAGEIEWAKARMIEPGGYEPAVEATNRRLPIASAHVADLYERYERQKHRRRLVDFDDLIAWCVRALEGDADFVAAQRFRFRHFFVDEFQDVTPAQLRLLRAWLGERDDLCVVGDPDQAIYRFAGAEPDYLTRFTHHFPGATVVRLDTNYRSTPQIVRTARAVLGGPHRAEVRTPGADGPAPIAVAYETDTDEARAVALALRDAHASGRPWSTMAVLYRTNAQSVLFEEAMVRLDIPARVRGTSRFLDRPEVAATLSTLRANARRAPGRPFAQHLVDLRDDAGAVPDERREHAAALVTLGREYLAHDGGAGSVDGFLAWLGATLRSDDADVDASDAVDLLTFHRAKGLEYDTVFMCGLERGLVPISHASTPDALDDERRLLYVASSRAARVLHMSWARNRTLGGRNARREPSPWLDAAANATRSDHEADRASLSGPPPALQEARALLAHATRPIASAAAPVTTSAPCASDDPLLASLVDWRRGVARAAAVPAYLVATDAMLRAIADVRPTSQAALARVPGIGPARLDRYGEPILHLVARAAGDR